MKFSGAVRPIKESSSDAERVVFVIQELENLADMEGWEYFFMHRIEVYPELTRALIEVGDTDSLQVLTRYEG